MMRLSKPPQLVFNFKYSIFPNLKVVSALLAFTVFSVPFSEASFSDQTVFFAWFWVGGAVTVVVIGVLFLMKNLLEKQYGPRIPLLVIVYGAGIIGGLKGASTEFLVNLVTLQDTYPWDEIAIRAYSGSFLGVGLAFAFCLKATYSADISDSYNKYHEENLLLAQEVATLGREIALVKEISTDRILENVVNNIRPLKTIDVLASDPKKNWRKISEALHIGLATRVRQESYDMHYVGDKPLTIKEQIQKVFLLEKVNLHPRVLALVQFSTGASITYVDWNPRNSILQLIINTFVSITVTTYFRTLLRNRVRPSRFFNLCIVSGVIIVNGSLYALVGYIFWSSFNLYFQISLFFWHTFLVLTISSVSEIIQHVNAQKELQLSVNQDLQDKKEILSKHLEYQTQEISKHLHGFLITKIHTSTTLLDNYAQKGDYESYRRELKQLLQEFTFDGLRSSLNRDVISSDYFAELPQSWEGLIEVSLKTPENLNPIIKKAQRIELAHVVEELISNAYRHGEAQLITIKMRWKDELNLEIVATDNGKGTVVPVKKGLGSKIFDSATDGNWSIRDIAYKGVEVKLAIRLYDLESQVGS